MEDNHTGQTYKDALPKGTPNRQPQGPLETRGPGKKPWEPPTRTILTGRGTASGSGGNSDAGFSAS